MGKITGIGFVSQFAMDDFKTKYAGSLLGFIWAFLQPVITVVIYWFVFQIGFGSQPVDGIPFIVWLVSGIAPWFFISDAITNSTSSLVDYSYLVKKVVFNIDILPLARIIAVLFIQVFLLLFTFILSIAYGVMPSPCSIQVIYYMAYMVVLCAGVAYATSALYVFFKDIVQLVAIVIQVVFWLTPIVWNLKIMPERVQQILKYNPVFYVIEGYRDALVRQDWLTRIGLGMHLYYWIVALGFLFVGKATFKRLKPHFADVL